MTRPRWATALVTAASVLLVLLAVSRAALGQQPFQPIDMGVDIERVDITSLGRTIDARGDALQVETAVAADGTSGRMSVRAATSGTSPNWFVFAMRNPTDKPLERWLVADRYAHAGSGVIWPQLDARRVEAVTPSLGFVPERMPFDNADAFRLHVEPGQTVTFVVELAGDRLTRLNLWRGVDYEKRSRNRQLFQGILLGIVGLLALFLTTIFAANHKAIFPSAALFTWCVLVYLLVDFGFWPKLFNVKPEENAQYRAASEAAIGASLLIFAHTFLRLGRWHALIRMLIGLAMIATLTLVGLAFLDPRLAATFARVGLVGVLVASALVTAYLAMRGQDRALAIIPTWVLFGVWAFAAALVLTGRLQSDVIVNGLIAGLVLLVMLIGFTVTQFAFRSVESQFGTSPDDQQLRALAVDSTGAGIFEWNGKREEVRLGAIVLASLGQKPQEIREPLTRFVERMHAADRDRLVQVLSGLKDDGRGLVQLDFRLKHVDNSYRWFELEGSGVATSERRMARCVGLVREVTDAKRSLERLQHDAVHDSLTQTPNRGLFLDRLSVVIARAQSEPLVRPTVLYIDLDQFKTVNAIHGTPVGDSLLMTVAKRLQRMLGPSDALARVGGDQFAVMTVRNWEPRELQKLAEDIRAAVKSPINIAAQEIVLTCSIGVALLSARTMTAQDLLGDAEVAMYRARRGGADRIEVFQPAMRADKDDRLTIEADLRQAIERRQLTILFQPIMLLRTEELAGFEAQVRWEHPRHGVLDPAAFVPMDQRSDLMARLGSLLLQSAIVEAQRWNREFPRPIFVSVNVSQRQLFHPDLINEVRHLLAQSKLPKDMLRLEITEALVMENPARATTLLKDLTATGVKLSLDDFGAGYSSLSYLTAFPFDTVKVDSALVHAATQSAEGSAVLRSIVALCHELGKVVVAEGADGEEQAGLMRALGCDHAQGAFYGEGRSARETISLLKDMRRDEKRRKGGGLFRLKTRRIEDDASDTAATEVLPADQAASDAKKTAAKRRTTLRPRPAQINGTAPPLPHQGQGAATPPRLPAQPQPSQMMPPQPPPMPLPVAPPPQMVKVPPVPPPSVEPLSIERSLSRLKAEIARSNTPTTRLPQQSDSARPPPIPAPIAPAAAVAAVVTAAPEVPRERHNTPPSQPFAVIATPAAARSEPVPAPAPVRPAPDLSTLPPAIAASLAKLAGLKQPSVVEQQNTETRVASTGTDGASGGS